MIRRLLANYFRLGVNTASFLGNMDGFPPGMTPDASALFGLNALLSNIGVLDFDLVSVVGGASVTINLTGAQAIANVIDYSGSPAGGVTMNLPSLAAFLAALPSTLPGVGTLNYPMLIINDSAGQIVTLTGTTGVTVVGTATIATATVRLFLVSATPTGITLVNCGGWSL